MTKPRIGVVGRVIAGKDVGRYVEVVDNTKVSGGFYILTFENADRSGIGYDIWVDSLSDVDLYFVEINWDIEWLEAGDP